MTTALKYEDKLKELERFARENWPRGIKEFYNFTALTVDQVAEALAALRDTGWNERDGRCWCDKPPETTGQHERRCARARAALAALDQRS